MADALYQGAGGAGGQRVERQIPGLSRAHPGADLDQLMVGQGPVHFCHHPRGEPGRAEHDHRAQGVGQPAEVLFLFFSQCHGFEYSDPQI